MLVNLLPRILFFRKDLYLMFSLTRDVGLPWLPYVAILTVLISIVSVIGFALHKQWAFYTVYLAYLAGTLVVWFPFFPGFLLVRGARIDTNSVAVKNVSFTPTGIE